MWRFLIALVGLSSALLNAQPYPTKPIRWIIDFPAGGASDTLARVVGEKLTAVLGQQIIYDNRAGANGTIAYGLGAKALPDGYTWVMLSTPFPLNAALGRKLTYDSLKDFTPIARIADYPNLLIVHPSVPVRTVKEFVALAKAKPGAVTYGSSGNGSVQHLAMELLGRLANIQMLHVPYAGSAPAAINLAGGHVDTLATILITAMPHIRAGRMRVIGIMSEKRSPQLPEVPTFTEAGIALVAPGWGGVGGPAGLPRPIVQRIDTELARIVTLPDVRERLAAVGAEPRHSSSDELAAFIRSEIERWRPIIQQAGVKVD
jgi:tripartite-type tricarboxylate transporter receptor subunit TctC